MYEQDRWKTDLAMAAKVACAEVSFRIPVCPQTYSCEWDGALKFCLTDVGNSRNNDIAL